MDCTVSPPERQGLHRRQTAPVEVTVIGAGPAGALLAYLLATHGLRVVLVDKARLPRRKPCGGGLTQKAVALLPFAIDAVVERVVTRLVFTCRLRHPYLYTYPEPLVTLVTRCRFDALLVQQAAVAGAQVYDACKVTRCEQAPQYLILYADKATWRSRYVAFADGATSPLRRQVGFTTTPPYDIGLDMQIEAPGACPWRSDTLYIDWGSWPRCYGWAFPKADHWSIGVKGPASQSRLLVAYLSHFMQHWRCASAVPLPPYLAHILPTRLAGMPLVRGRTLVVGDAAGLIDPFTGEGIYYALRSAQLAAEALLHASAADSSLYAYETAIDAEIMPALTAAGATQRLFDAFPGLFHVLMHYRRRYWRVLVELLRSAQGFAELGQQLYRHPYLVRSLLWLSPRIRKRPAINAPSGG